jgi:hypothetical protein
MFARAGWMILLLATSVAVSSATAMSQERVDPAVLRKHLDDLYPFIDQSAEPPGRWRPSEWHPGQSWSGKMGWRTRHGDAVVRWNLGKPVHISNARLSDRSEVEAQATMGSPLPWRYRLPGAPRRWQHGTVEIRSDGVTFTPGEPPDYAPPAPTDGPNLEADLARDEALRRRLADDAFADVLYAYLKNGEFWKEGGDRIVGVGLSGGGGLVANLRGHGDTYIDYYPHGGAGPITETTREARRRFGKPEMLPEEAAVQEKKLAWFDEITNTLRALGWRRATAEDKATAAAETRRALTALEERIAAEMPEWATKVRPPTPPSPGAVMILRVPPLQMSEQERQRHEEIVSQSLRKRLNALAVSGRITELEYRSMLQRINQIP